MKYILVIVTLLLVGDLGWGLWLDHRIPTFKVWTDTGGNTLAMRGGNPQAFRVYSTYTDTQHYTAWFRDGRSDWWRFAYHGRSWPVAPSFRRLPPPVVLMDGSDHTPPRIDGRGLSGFIRVGANDDIVLVRDAAKMLWNRHADGTLWRVNEDGSETMIDGTFSPELSRAATEAGDK